MDSLVSPTKARQAAIEAKDWAYVNSWLTRKYAPQQVPSFERNEETLKTLLAIATANDAAVEESSLLHRAREDVVRILGQREATEENSLVRHILDDVETQLDPRAEQALTDLAETAVLMGRDSTDVSELASGFLQLTRDEAEFANQVRHVQALQGYLDKEMALVRQEIDEIKSHPGYETPMDLTAKTGEWTRNAKMLAAKISEYRSRITSLQRKTNVEDVSIEQVVQEERKVQELRSAISKLEAKIKSYHDLPPDIDDARNEYKRLEGELVRLTNERDELFQTRF